MEWEELSSLVGSIHTRSLVARPTTIEQCREALAYCREHDLTLCPRGAGRSYGDQALNDRHILLDMSTMNRILEFDEEAAQITVEAGTRLIDIYQLVHYRLLTLPASPTESHSSVAGAICANVNGKDAWRQGSFADQVVRLTLLLADGETLDIDRSHELFNAVVGGIGLLGIIVDATLQLKPIPSPYVEINRIPAPDVDALLETMARSRNPTTLAVVWVDAYANGSRTGRSVIHAARSGSSGDDTEVRAPGAASKQGYERLDKHRRLGLALHEKPFGPVLSLMLQAQRPMMNVLQPALLRDEPVGVVNGTRPRTPSSFSRFSFEASFTVPPAHLVCGPRGYTVQLTFPRSSAREAIIELLGICQSSPCPPVTTILRAHKADDGLLSFSEDGYSLNFEFHPKKRHQAASRAGRRPSDRGDGQARRQDPPRQGPGPHPRAVLPRLSALPGALSDQATTRSGGPVHLGSGPASRHRPHFRHSAGGVETTPGAGMYPWEAASQCLARNRKEKRKCIVAL